MFWWHWNVLNYLLHCMVNSGNSMVERSVEEWKPFFFYLLLYYPSCKRVIFEKTFWANTKWVLNCILNAKWWGRFKTMHFLSCILHLVLGAYLAMWYYLLILVPAKLLSNLITLIRNICNYKSKIFSAHSKRRFMSMLFAYGCPLLLIPTLFIFIT